MKKFRNLDGSSSAKQPWDILRWKLHKNPLASLKKEENYRLKVLQTPHPPQIEEDFICWLGHASFLIQLEGKRLLLDPCLTAPPFFTRYAPLPFPIESIRADYILISHGHYDHLDAKTLKYFSEITLLAPLKMEPLLTKINPSFHILEANWFQSYPIQEDFEIYFLPAHHWHKRTLFDTNQILWGSFLIKKGDLSIYFAGDTAYTEHFKLIAKQFGNISIALLPIGAYEPDWLMRDNHMSPTDALKAYKDLHAGMMIPMHFGTFDLSDELLSAPEKVLKENITDENIRFLSIGETLKL
jgi:L-ascorbate metabolism protein UlaG (beta-lactamase superfamily)